MSNIPGFTGNHTSYNRHNSPGCAHRNLVVLQDRREQSVPGRCRRLDGIHGRTLIIVERRDLVLVTRGPGQRSPHPVASNVLGFLDVDDVVRSLAVDVAVANMHPSVRVGSGKFTCNFWRWNIPLTLVVWSYQPDIAYVSRIHWGRRARSCPFIHIVIVISQMRG